MKFTSKTINAGTNAKTVKGDSSWVVGIMYLAPYKLSGVGNLCSMAELAKCHEPCLNKSGRGRFNTVQAARVRKSKWFLEDRTSFVTQLFKDIERFRKKCEQEGVKPAVRLNGTSDIRWEGVFGPTGKNAFEQFPDVQFYDYTKIPNRKTKDIENYHLTWSYSEANEKYMKYSSTAKQSGMNIAVVFRDEFPRKFLNYPVTDGDKDDLRFLDPKNSVIGLKAKGPAKKDQSGFVVDA